MDRRVIFYHGLFPPEYKEIATRQTVIPVAEYRGGDMPGGELISYP